ncbi:MAG: DNA polymerase III subunit epsilon [Gammaproteobacteria bacterium]|nr:DNA polymerase III subunit epsilon [Gammaproteobacteria bacterium]
MRQVVLDTETTGLEPTQGHRIIEIGCVEVINRRRTTNYFHQYLNPERDVEDGAYDVHGLSKEFLAGKPLFKDVAADFIGFIRDSELIIHNAPFDVAFINAELEQLGPEWGRLEEYCKVVDSLKIARELHPGQKNSLDALCSRYSIDNSQRDVHGALLDAQLLLDVYLAMTGGQTSLSLEDELYPGQAGAFTTAELDRQHLNLIIIEPSAEEAAEHEKFLDALEKGSGARSIWRSLEGEH